MIRLEGRILVMAVEGEDGKRQDWDYGQRKSSMGRYGPSGQPGLSAQPMAPSP